MTPWQTYWIILQADLLEFAKVLGFTAIGMVAPAIGVTFWASARQPRPCGQFASGALLIAWLVLTLASLAAFLFGWGLATQLYLRMRVDVETIPIAFWSALFLVSLGVGVVVSYRHTSSWLRGCLAESSSPTSDQPARRWRFTLVTLVVYQLILLLAGGLWIECRRDWAMEQFAQQQRLAEYDRWRISLDERFASLGFDIEVSKATDSERHLRLLPRRSMPNWPDLSRTLLESIETKDGLVELGFRSDELTDEDFQFIARHTRLSRLTVVAPQLTDAGVAELKELSNLRFLYLKCPQLTDKCLDGLPGGFRGQAWIESSNITSSAVERFNETAGYPDLQIVNDRLTTTSE